MSLRYIKTSAPSYVTGAAMTTPEQFTDNINFYSEGYNPYQIVLESDATPPVQVGLVSMENNQQQQLPLSSSSEESNDVSIEDDVDEELSDAENYWILFCETGDSVYKEMANDELKHAGILIKKHLLKTTDEKRKHSLNEQEKKRQEMLKIVSVSKSDG